MAELDLTNIARTSIATPGSGVVALFSDSLDKTLRSKDDTGRVRTLGSYFFDVKSYGATGDGSTDDTAAINLAIAACTTATGGTIFFPKGTYIVTATLTDIPSNTTLCGENRGASIISAKTTFVSGDIIRCVSGGDSVTIRDIFITSQSATARTSGASINSNGCHDVHIHSINIYYPYVGVLVGGGSSKFYMNDFDIKVPTALTTSANSASIHINNLTTGDTYIGRGNCESASGAGKAQYGIRIQTTGYIQLDHVACTAADVGLAINPGAGTETAINIFVAFCLFDTCVTNGATFTTTLAANKIRQVRFTDCWFSGTTAGNGMLFTVTAGVIDDISFNNCRVLSNFNHGISTAGAGIASLTNLSVSGSIIAGNSVAGSAVSHGVNIIAGMGRFSFIDNRICTVDTFSSFQSYGINIAAGTYSSYILRNNDCTGNVTGAINDLGVITGQSQKLSENNIGGLNIGRIGIPITANVAVAANANTIVAGGLNVCPIPANCLKIGTHIRVTIEGTFTGTVTATAMQLHLGTAGTVADAVILTASVTGAVGTSRGKLILECTIRTIGAAGTLVGSVLLLQVGVTGLGNAAVLDIVGTTTTAPNTTVANYLTVSLLSAAAGSSGTVQTGYIEIL